MILAQAAAGGYSIVQLLIIVIIVAACVGIMYVALQQFGVQIPRFVVAIFWICVCACLAIFAIRFVAGL
jgi:hypothetical protein